MTHVITLNHHIIDTCLIYKQMCKVTSFLKHLRLLFVKYLRKFQQAGIRCTLLQETTKKLNIRKRKIAMRFEQPSCANEEI